MGTVTEKSPKVEGKAKNGAKPKEVAKRPAKAKSSVKPKAATKPVSEAKAGDKAKAKPAKKPVSKATSADKAVSTESEEKSASKAVATKPTGSSEVARPSMAPVIEHILHGEVDRTFDQVIAEVGLDPEQGLLIWRILGFDDSSADGLVFNKTDVDALKAFKRAVDREMLTLEDMLEMMRAIAQTTSRLADWQITIVGKRLEALGLSEPDKAPTDEELAKVIKTISGLRPILERLLLQVWRRQTVDSVLRSDRANAKPADASDIGTVAFADMVGFTRLSREIEPHELARLVERFEQIVTLIAAETGAKLMKTIGDEVLIMSAFPQDVAEFALKLQEFSESADDFPELRIGIATGPLISQMGDVFGETVNRASRLTAFAKPSSTYVDTETHEALEVDLKYRFKSTRMRAIQGFSRINAWELRRTKLKQ